MSFDSPPPPPRRTVIESSPTSLSTGRRGSLWDLAKNSTGSAWNSLYSVADSIGKVSNAATAKVSCLFLRFKLHSTAV